MVQKGGAPLRNPTPHKLFVKRAWGPDWNMWSRNKTKPGETNTSCTCVHCFQLVLIRLTQWKTETSGVVMIYLIWNTVQNYFVHWLETNEGL